MRDLGRKKTEQDLTSGSIFDKVLAFAIPLALTSMLQQLFNATDVAIVGRFASKQAMAAVGGNAPVVSLLVNFFVGLSVGANVVIAKNIGAKAEKKANSAVHTALILSLICGVFIAVVGNLIAQPIIGLLGVPEDTVRYSVTYLRLYFAGMPFIMLYNFEAAIFRSNGDTKKPLLCLSIGGIFNVFANLFFVIVLGMDVDGVAIATVLANCISSMLLLRYLRKEESVIHVDFKSLRIDKSILKNILEIGLPSGLQAMVFSISNLCVQSAVNSLGTDAMAGASAAFNIEILVYFLINAFTQTCVTFVGQNYGAGNYARCRECIRKIMLSCMAVTAVVSILILLLKIPILKLFTTDPQVIDYAVLRIRVILYAELVNVIMDNLSGAMRGLGKSLIPALVSLVAVCGTRITWVFTGFKIYHSWLSLMLLFPISWLISAAVLIFMYFKVRKQMLPASFSN